MNKNKKEALRAYYESKTYILFVAFLVLFGHTTISFGGRALMGGYQGIFALTLLVATVVLGAFVCNDARYLIMPVISVFYMITVEHTPNVPSFSSFLFEPFHLGWIIALTVIFLASVVYFVITNRNYTKPIPIKSPLFISLLIFCGAMLLNGVFSPYVSVSNLVFGASFLGTMPLLYLLFACYVRMTEKTFDYFMTCLMALGLLLCAQLLLAYVTGPVRFENGSVVKESVVLGWGIWTAIGGIMVFLLPATFYFAHSHKHGWIYYGLGLLELFCIFLTQSRGALLFGGLVFGVSILVLCLSGENRKLNRILTFSILGIGMIGGMVLWSKLSSLLQNYLTYGFGDNGRFEKWRLGWQSFLSAPAFGVGFYSDFAYQDFEKGIYPYFYHNTLIQFLASTGIVGTLAYLYHRLQTLLLVIRRPNPKKTFLGICLLGLLSFSLLDVIFFNTYPMLIYTPILVFMEHGCKGEL